MASKSIADKMKLKPGAKAVVIQAPAGYTNELEPPKGTKISDRLETGPFDWLQIFVRSSSELKSIAPRLKAALEPAALLWITFPKGSSGIQTDLTRNKGWESLQALDLKWINLVSVNETWSAFALRPYKEGEKRQSFH